MKYGLATVQDGIIFTSFSLDLILEQMSEYQDSYIVELEEKKRERRDYSEDFYNELHKSNL